MTVRQTLVNVWQTQSIKVNDLHSLAERFDLKTVIEVLRDLTLPNIRERITVNEAEEKLKESLFLEKGDKKCKV